MDAEQFKNYLRTGELLPNESESSDGGFIIPEFIDVPVPGKKAKLFRFVGSTLYLFGMRLHSIGMRLHSIGMKQISSIGVLLHSMESKQISPKE
ncbi:hypothetical protein LCGC14_0895530 [marine sediment metagenome]|uniref:Uncharacterized protein n=1 Tax=marine sediment metagenome TaxID=412755 RepID=A0A0F9NY30_9ZZZZ